MYIPLMQYTINGVHHRIIRDEEDNIMLEIRGYEVDINELIRALRHSNNQHEQVGNDANSD